MTTNELERKRDAIETNILAMEVCLVQQKHILHFVRGCIVNPTKDNLETLEKAEKDHHDWLVRMVSARLPRPAATDPAQASAAEED